jgi:hypothetical protein
MHGMAGLQHEPRTFAVPVAVEAAGHQDFCIGLGNGWKRGAEGLGPSWPLSLACRGLECMQGFSSHTICRNHELIRVDRVADCTGRASDTSRWVDQGYLAALSGALPTLL